MRAARLLLIGSLLAVLSVAPVGAHPGTLTDVVDGQGHFSYGPSEVHAAGAGEWCFTVTAITGHVGQVLVQIRDTVTEDRSFAGAHPRVGGRFCSYDNQTPNAGTFTVKAIAFGGQPGSTVTLSVEHP